MWRQGASQAMLHAVGMTPEDLNKAQARFFVTGSAEICIPAAWQCNWWRMELMDIFFCTNIIWKIILEDKIWIIPYYPILSYIIPYYPILSHDKWDVFHVYCLYELPKFRLTPVAGRHRLGLVSGQSLQYAPAILGGRREERGRQGRLFGIHDPLVNYHSYWKWPFIVSFPINNGDFP